MKRRRLNDNMAMNIPSSSTNQSPMNPSFSSQVPLTLLEKKLFDLLLSVSRKQSPPPTLRVAGGWVRDKILYPARDLGTNVDIDIALDSMLGIEFAELVNAYLESHNLDKASIGIIQKNPDQSKHLETATMRVMGICLDLVNLRTETYAHDSRIPDVKIGTPYEDAMRRDLTINALFYNINTGMLEDFTDKGFDDIRARIIRTPLPPRKTLLDDPLRALRAIRFASRLNFCFASPLFEACRDEMVHDALGAKVSRERISTEIDRVLICENPPHAIGLLVELQLFPVVFRLPPQELITDVKAPPPDLPDLSLGALLNLHRTPAPARCPAPRKLVRYAALLSPLAGCTCMFAERGKKRKEISIAQYIMRHELRLSVRDVTEVCCMLTAALALRTLIHKGASKPDRLEAGRVIRQAGPNWRSALQIALVTELAPATGESTYACGVDDRCAELGTECVILHETYRVFGEKVEKMGLDGVWDLKPLLDGVQVMKFLPGIQKGPVLGKIMRDQIEWRIRNPSGGGEEIGKWLLEKYKEFG